MDEQKQIEEVESVNITTDESGSSNVDLGSTGIASIETDTPKKSKMSRSTYNLLVRLLGGIAVALMLVSGTILLSNYISQKTIENSSLLSQASGLKDNTVMMTVGNEDVTADEFLYWVASYCSQFNMYYGITDFSEEIADGMTAADYVKMYAEQSCTQYALVRSWANDLGITLNDEDEATIDEQMEYYYSTYEDPEISALALKAQGLSEDLLRNKLLKVNILYNRIAEEYSSGSLRPSDADLDALVEEHDLITAKMVEIPLASYEEDDIKIAKETIQEYINRMDKASDKDAEWATIAEELEQEDVASIYDCCESGTICDKLKELSIGQYTSVEDDDGCQLILYRVATDYDQVAAVKCDEDLYALQETVSVTYSSAYENLDVESFYASFATLQSQVYTTISERTSTEESAE